MLDPPQPPVVWFSGACALNPAAPPHIWCSPHSPMQGEAVKLGNSCAALLEGRGASWADALAADSQWRLVRLLNPADA